MACCWYAVPGSDLEHAGYGIDYTGQRKQRFLRWIRYLLWDLESDTKFLAVDRHCNPAMDLQWMQFSEDLETLHTSQGNLNCRNGGWDTNKLYDYTPESSPAVSLDHDNVWVRFGGEDVLWLPESYRPQIGFDTAFAKNTIAYKCRTGGLVVMRFANPCDPPTC
jgi:hypothetical protein